MSDIMSIAKAVAIIAIAILLLNFFGMDFLRGTGQALTSTYFVAILLVSAGVYGVFKIAGEKLDAKHAIYGGILVAGVFFFFKGFGLVPLASIGITVPQDINIDLLQVINIALGVWFGLVGYYALKGKF